MNHVDAMDTVIVPRELDFVIDVITTQKESSVSFALRDPLVMPPAQEVVSLVSAMVMVTRRSISVMFRLVFATACPPIRALIVKAVNDFTMETL
jgi:hypothetical protein